MIDDSEFIDQTLAPYLVMGTSKKCYIDKKKKKKEKEKHFRAPILRYYVGWFVMELM